MGDLRVSQPSSLPSWSAKIIGGMEHLLVVVETARQLRISFSAGGTKLREAVLRRLMDAGRQLVPFRFIIYAGLAGIKMGPVM
jgi:hypothetical protein